jgi:hypothetical protein
LIPATTANPMKLNFWESEWVENSQNGEIFCFGSQQQTTNSNQTQLVALAALTKKGQRFELSIDSDNNGQPNEAGFLGVRMIWKFAKMVRFFVSEVNNKQQTAIKLNWWL